MICVGATPPFRLPLSSLVFWVPSLQSGDDGDGLTNQDITRKRKASDAKWIGQLIVSPESVLRFYF